MKSLPIAEALAGCLLLCQPVLADWPTHRLSPTRNAATAEALPAGQPEVAWRHTPAFRPSTAWHGPAKWDAYAVLRGLHSMRGYDQAYHATSAAGGVYYASSTEQAVRRLDAKTGAVDWTFYTDGAVRVAPTYAAGKLYFGSDDGYAYCIDAESGEEVWRTGPKAGTRLVVNNGSVIPLWPIRTGVTVVGDTAYFAASLLPWEKSYLYAVDAATGEVRYTQQLDEATFEGPLVASPRLLIAPQGRVAPVLFERETGKRLGQLSGGGGSFCVLLDDETTMHGPGNKAGWVTESNTKSQEKLATHEAARQVVNNGDTTFFITDKSVIAIDYASKNRLWSSELLDPLSLIAVGDAVVVGAVDRIVALEARSGDRLWSTAIAGRVKGLAFDAGQLLVSLDTGEIVALRPNAGAPAVDAVPEAEAIADAKVDDKQQDEKAHAEGTAEAAYRVADGPWLRFLESATALIEWRSAEPTQSVIEWTDPNGDTRTLRPSNESVTEHQVRVENLGLNQVSHYRIVDGDQPTESYECDTFFNYSPQPIPPGEARPQASVAARDALRDLENRRGLCFVLGVSDDGALAEAIARQTEMRVVAFDPDAQRVAAVRRRLESEGLYGARITAHAFGPEHVARITDGVASLIVSGSSLSDRQTPYYLGEFERLLSPNGRASVRGPEGEPLVTHGSPYLGAGDWTHVYGSADNSAFGGESLDGAQKTDDLAVQWIGRPGPRYQADRNGRKTPPIAADGRLFLQGLDRVVAVDAFNGSILWSLETPHFRRFNMPRDCGNWCTDGEQVFAAVRDRCWRIDASTGEIVESIPVPAAGLPDQELGYEWGYIARDGDRLIGSANATGANWTYFWGGLGWYDKTEGPATHQVASDRLFALEADSGAPRWTTDRVVLNATITVSQGLICFVESRNPGLTGGTNRRLGGDELWNQLHLTALDASTGQQVWSEPLDQVMPGKVVVWLSAQQGKLALVTSAEVKFDVNVYDLASGAPLWRREADWGKGKADHGTHLSRPAIVGDRLIVRPAVFDLATGATDENSMPVSGCGTYACTTDAMFFRAWSGQQFAVWSPETGDYSRWARLRPDCWLSTIPASGLLLSPEGGGGCSCGSWLETSLAFVPKSRLQARDD